MASSNLKSNVKTPSLTISPKDTLLKALRPKKLKYAFPIIDGILFIKSEEISYFKSDAQYTLLYSVTGEKFYVLKPLKWVEEQLSERHFVRTHKSYLANFDKIRMYLKKDGGELIMECGTRLPISRRRKEEIFNIL